MYLSGDEIKWLEKANAAESLKWLAEKFPAQVVFSSSLGQEDQVITDLIFRNGIPIQVFTLDLRRGDPCHQLQHGPEGGSPTDQTLGASQSAGHGQGFELLDEVGDLPGAVADG